jgi:hypothetical protein
VMMKLSKKIIKRQDRQKGTENKYVKKCFILNS